MNAPERVAVAERAARAGAAVAHDWFRTDLDIETKRDKTDSVTEADRRAQERVVSEFGAGAKRGNQGPSDERWTEQHQA